MTPADLPPCQTFSNTPMLQAAFELMAKDYAKLAVRQALERAAVECEATLVREGFHSAFRCAANVRAIIKEYSDE